MIRRTSAVVGDIPQGEADHRRRGPADVVEDHGPLVGAKGEVAAREALQSGVLAVGVGPAPRRPQPAGEIRLAVIEALHVPDHHLERGRAAPVVRLLLLPVRRHVDLGGSGVRRTRDAEEAGLVRRAAPDPPQFSAVPDIEPPVAHRHPTVDPSAPGPAGDGVRRAGAGPDDRLVPHDLHPAGVRDRLPVVGASEGLPAVEVDLPPEIPRRRPDELDPDGPRPRGDPADLAVPGARPGADRGGLHGRQGGLRPRGARQPQRQQESHEAHPMRLHGRALHRSRSIPKQNQGHPDGGLKRVFQPAGCKGLATNEGIARGCSQEPMDCHRNETMVTNSYISHLITSS